MKLNGEKLTRSSDGDLLGLVVGFSLPSSAYATCAVRELCKTPQVSEFLKGLPLDNRPPGAAEEDQAKIVQQIEKFAKEAKVGDSHAFPPTLDNKERHLVHDTCEKMGGLQHESKGQGGDRHIVIVKLLGEGTGFGEAEEAEEAKEAEEGGD
jgi:hypothetical protein